MKVYIAVYYSPYPEEGGEILKVFLNEDNADKFAEEYPDGPDDQHAEIVPFDIEDSPNEDAVRPLDDKTKEMLVAFIKWVGDGYDFENDAEKIVEEYLNDRD